MPRDWLLEVIVASVADAREAEAGGADRLEIVRDLEVGGLTPSLETVRAILGAVSVPARAMVRESPDFVVTDEADRRRLLAAATAFGALPLDGLVLGFLEGGRVDMFVVEEMLAAAPALGCTFHRAFEEVDDPLTEIGRLKTLPQIDRILTSGSVEALEYRRRAAAPEIEILAGGGMTLPQILELRASSGVREFHVGSAVRDPPASSGAVKAELVRALRAAVEAPG